MNSIEIGTTVYFIPIKTEANNFSKYNYELQKRHQPDMLSGEVVKKGLFWKSTTIDDKVQLIRVDLLLVKDTMSGNLWSIRTENVFFPNIQPSNS